MKKTTIVAVDHSIIALKNLELSFKYEKTMIFISVSSFVELKDIPDADIVIYDLGISLLEGNIYNYIDNNCLTIATCMIINANTMEKAIEDGASALIKKPYDCNALKSKIYSLLQSPEETAIKCVTLDERLSHIFISGGITPNNIGFRYLKESIKISIDNPEMLTNITKMLYPTVAEKFNTKSTRVERDIRHVIELAWNRGKILNLNKFFALNVFDVKDKPTNSELIALLADKLSYERPQYFLQQM